MIAVTGANGFVGRRLVAELHARGARVRALTRSSAPGIFPPGVDHQTVGEIHADTDWSETLRGVEAIVHAAGRAHVLNDRVEDPRAAYFATNAAGTERLARAAVEAGVKRLIFVSSVKVNGEATNGAPFTERTPPSPVDAYAVSKWQAEQRLHELSRASGLEVVVVRPPLVYGPGVKANFLHLIQAVARGIPLPIGGVDNRRSLIFVGNLVDALIRVVEIPAAAGETFLVSDGAPVSTPELVRAIARALGRRPRLVHLPAGWLTAAARLAGMGAAADRLLGSLVVDDTRIREVLGWTPPFTLEQGLAETASWWRDSVRS